MNNRRLRELLELYLDDSASDLEQSELRDYINDPFYDAEFKNLIGQAFDQQIEGVELTEYEQRNFLEFIYAKDKSVIGRSRKLWPRMIGIAAAVAVVVLGIYFFNYRNDKNAESNVLAAQDIAPGTVGATLTLANGKKIKLSEAANGALAKEAGIIVSKTADGQLVYELKESLAEANNMNTLSTAKGECYIVTLPDKSKVWLNAASSLTYSASLVNDGKRRVKLRGEAYFEITKDKAHPFVVESNKQQVEVLGTHFNVNSYLDEPVVTTTLIEGSVKVTSGDIQKVIHPGEQVLNARGSLVVTKANLDNITDWKNGDFNLTNIDFRVAMRKVARWYNVELIYDSTVPENIQADGWISRKQTLSAVLDMIQRLGIVHFRVEGNKVYVSK